ncbi:MAG: electron transfer flavoprotein subunit alpha/FixB family protein [Gammaproteobacteria bacterium]|jgi:electron transfer flavoprotein alpha subunit|nr:electron transfer flavoprotein subunit alpha/FixB family protein [Gammaproteobacteria bacterium]NBR18047.1 electron transfer flavoprotein subunit alpha/FixB family protein [Gammaproteobacteria bacterium]NCW57081.1 electron transfer flavoprotein subunit alpha/FixB family protein [Gammaproteobacteria bacterium]NDA42599.1 electron transfer flavoprotein subunit alpha/FixB family protein [Gammaproteobacteria bacterium]NDB15909.1 electron transfer flavoprotein subunit alpha/FixB family protein [Ga
MSKILIVAEHAGGKLNPVIAKCVHCASGIAGAEIHLAVFAADASAVAAQAAQIAGVAKVVTVTHAIHANPLAATLAPQLAELAQGYTHVFGPSTTFGKDLMPRVAALLDAPQASDIMAAESATRFKRPIYAGNAIITVEVAAGSRVVATVRTASFEAAGAAASPAPIEAVTLSATLPTHTRFVSVTSARSDRPDLQTAKKVVSGGRALASADNFKILYSLADKMGAAVGASRAAVDAGYAANDMQVGQTGKIIAPDIYLAFGISGAIQHLTGIKDARTIVAINKDPEAPIFEVADYGLVGDLFQVAPEFEKLISSGS